MTSSRESPRCSSYVGAVPQGIHSPHIMLVLVILHVDILYLLQNKKNRYFTRILFAHPEIALWFQGTFFCKLKKFVNHRTYTLRIIFAYCLI